MYADISIEILLNQLAITNIYYIYILDGKIASPMKNLCLWQQSLGKTGIEQELTQAESSRLWIMQMELLSNSPENLNLQDKQLKRY